jgi:glutamate--cysteine ligase
MPDTIITPVIATLKTLLDTRGEEVHHWLDEQRMIAPPLLYTSVDIRHGGFKIAPVDCNLFPAGFNNLSAAARHRAVAEFRHFFRSLPVLPAKALIIPENHTRNLGYLENLSVLSELLRAAGLEVRIGRLDPETKEPLPLVSLSGKEVIEYPVTRENNQIRLADGFTADAIILNHDLTSGAQPLLEGLSQPVFPSPLFGWYRRRKSEHFTQYHTLVHDFCTAFEIDSWLMEASFHRCGVVRFDERRSLEKVAEAAQAILDSTRDRYAHYGVSETPYVFVKADSGTYGMGIMTARSGEELLELNKKTRNKMKTIKEGTESTEVIIQEGVPTFDRIEGKPAEPMLYLVNGHPVGGAYRVNSERDAYNNLNAQGMQFSGMCDETESDLERVTVSNCNLGVFGLIATLSALACPREKYSDFDYAI